MDYIYVIKCNEDCYKIGKTSNNPPRYRIQEMQTGNPYKLKFEFVYCFDCTNILRTEQNFHRMFKEKHISGEWFKLNEFDLQKIRETCLFLNGRILEESEYGFRKGYTKISINEKHETSLTQNDISNPYIFTKTFLIMESLMGTINRMVTSGWRIKFYIESMKQDPSRKYLNIHFLPPKSETIEFRLSKNGYRDIFINGREMEHGKILEIMNWEMLNTYMNHEKIKYNENMDSLGRNVRPSSEPVIFKESKKSISNIFSKFMNELRNYFLEKDNDE